MALASAQLLSNALGIDRRHVLDATRPLAQIVDSTPPEDTRPRQPPKAARITHTSSHLIGRTALCAHAIIIRRIVRVRAASPAKSCALSGSDPAS